MSHCANNIFTTIPEQLSKELISTLLKRNNVHIERIVSNGHSTPAGQWYDQNWDEWIILLQGQATLSYQHQTTPTHLIAGDYLLIPANTLHRVDWTPADTNTIWLAVHITR